MHVAGAALTNAQANNLMSLDGGFGAGVTATPTSIRLGARLIYYGKRLGLVQWKGVRRSVDPDTGILTELTITLQFCSAGILHPIAG